MIFPKLFVRGALLVCAALIYVLPAQAQLRFVDITEVLVDSATDTITIRGKDFDFGTRLRVRLGDPASGDDITTNCTSQFNLTPQEIVCDLSLSGGLPAPGDYRLKVSTGQPFRKKDEFEITIGAVGPEGPQGPQGEQGPVGPQGEQGPAGVAGAQGPVGPQGEQGPTGLAGSQGPTGPIGDTGPAGPIGPQGDTGSAGAAGPQGEQGPTGDTGPQGVQGLTGLTGPQGEQGPPGDPSTDTLGVLGPFCSGSNDVAVWDGLMWNCSTTANTVCTALGAAAGCNLAAVIAQIANNSPKCTAGDRFVDLENGTIQDCNTSLIWLKDANCLRDSGGPADFATANANASTLASGSCGLSDGSVAGDWRLPDVTEFCSAADVAGGSSSFPCPAGAATDSLINSLFAGGPGIPSLSDRAGTGPWSEGDPFTNVGSRSSAVFWTATESIDPGFGWFVDMNLGFVNDNEMQTAKFSAWPVRDPRGPMP